MEGQFFLKDVGRIAVYIFLYISGVALAKSYGIDNLGISFIKRRFYRLAFPTWITLVLFYGLDYFCLGRTFSFGRILLSFLGIIQVYPPNPPMWFITYILYLYLLYFVVSHIRLVKFGKILILLFSCYMTYLPVMVFDFIGMKIIGGYTIIFPVCVTIGLYSSRLKEVSYTNYRKFPLLYWGLILLLLFEHFSGVGIQALKQLNSSYIYTKVISSLAPLTFVISLTLIIHILDGIQLKSGFWAFAGRYSFEIYLLHFPFMVSYDFLLFRKPFTVWLIVYLLYISVLGLLLKSTAALLNRTIFGLIQSDAANA